MTSGLNNAATQSPRIISLAAGAAGMYCGSCLRDNRLAATLIAQGRDVILIPLYTPLKTDEPDVSTARIFYGGINVYLDQVSRVFRRLPAWSTRLMDARFLLKRIARFASRTRPTDLGPLTVSVLNGLHGPQRRELLTLMAALCELRPHLITLPNLMFLGVADELKRTLGVPILCTLSGEDIFLDALPEPFRRQAFDLIRANAKHVDGFVAVTNYFADHAAAHFALPRERINVVPMGIRSAAIPLRAEPPSYPFTMGYLGRICPEKGLRLLAEAMIHLRNDGRNCIVKAAGYLSAADRPYLDAVREMCRAAGYEQHFEYVGEVTWEQKLEFLSSLNVLSVPTVYREAKGFYVLEAMAAGVPVVQPNHGSFPELIEATGGGILFEPGNLGELAAALARLMDAPELRAELGRKGREAVLASFNETRMADESWKLYNRLIGVQMS